MNAENTTDACDADIACTLLAGERPERATELASLFAHTLGWDRTDRSLHVRFPAVDTVEEKVRTLTALESACCAFLTFRTLHDDAQLTWQITAPSVDAAAVLDEFVALLPRP